MLVIKAGGLAGEVAGVGSRTLLAGAPDLGVGMAGGVVKVMGVLALCLGALGVLAAGLGTREMLEEGLGWYVMGVLLAGAGVVLRQEE